MTKQNSRGLMLILATALISGFSIFANKLAVSGLNPYLFTGLKNALVAVFLILILLKTNQWSSFGKLTLETWAYLLLIGLIGGSLPFLLFFRGLTLTSAASASLIHKDLFLFVAPLAVLFLREKVQKRFFLGAIFILLGNALLLKIFSFRLQAGDFLVLLATVSWAFENVLAKKVLYQVSPQIVAFGRMFFGSIFIGLFLLFNRSLWPGSPFTLGQISWILTTSFLLLAYVLTWYPGLKEIPATLATSLLTLGSPVTTLLSLIFLGAVPNLGEISGFICLILGVMILLRARETVYGKLKISRPL